MSAYVHKQTYIRMLVAAIFKVETTQVAINRKWVKKKKKWYIHIMEYSQQ